MSAILTTVLIDVAARVGAPLVKSLLERYAGGEVADIGGTIIDTIAEKAGVTPAQLPTLPPKDLEAAVRQTEPDVPDLVLAWNEQQREANRLMIAEMDKGGPVWTWAWRPAGMYFLGACWALYILAYPLLNLVLRLSGVSDQLQTLVDVSTLLAISGGYISLYMGGNTALRIADKVKGRD